MTTPERLRTKAARHPTGVVGSLTAVVMLLLPAFGVDIDPEIVAAIIGAVVAVVSALSPRQ